MKQTPEGRWRDALRGEGADDFHTAIVPQSEGMHCVCVCICEHNNQNTTYGCRSKEEGRLCRVQSLPPSLCVLSSFSPLVFDISSQILCFCLPISSHFSIKPLSVCPNLISCMIIVTFVNMPFQ